MAEESCIKMKIYNPKNKFTQGNYKCTRGLNTVCTIVTVVVINSLILGEYPVSGKVLTVNQKFVDKKSGEDNHQKFVDNYDEYYEDSFEDSLQQNFVDEYEHDLDGEVRFITEDDVEESYNDDAEETHHRGPRIVHMDPRCPDLPQPSKLTENLCKAKSCLNDDDCRHMGGYKKSKYHQRTTYICCFNGCLHSCLPKVDPPIAFDWLEETEVKNLHDNSTTSDIKPAPKALLWPDDGIEKVQLPGGCFITQNQLKELRLFRKFEHVEACTCLNGEVVCQINPRVSLKAELQGSKLAI